MKIFSYLLAGMLMGCVWSQQISAQAPVHADSSSLEWEWSTVPNTFQLILEADTLQIAPKVAAVEDEWWKIFGYPELDRLETMAQAQNYDLHVIQSRISEARSRVKIAQANYYPQIQLNPSYTYQSLAPTRPIGFDIPLSRVGLSTYSLPLEASYEVDLWGRLRNNTQATRYELEATLAQQENVQLVIAGQVALNFFALRVLDTQKSILDRTYTTRLDNLDIAETRFKAGLVNEIDVQRAKTELASVQVQLKNNALLRTELEIALAVLCGQEPQTFQIETGYIQYLPPNIAPDIPSSLRNRRPDLRQADLYIHASEAQTEQTRKALYPRLNVIGSLGLLSGEPEDLFAGKSQTWLIGANLAVPLFEGGRRKAELEVRQHQLETSRKLLDQLNLEAYREVETALSALQRLQEQLEAQQTFVEAAQQAAELSKQRYTKGLVTYLEVADSERIVLNAELLAAQLLGEQLQATVSLIQSLGGYE